MSMSYDVIWHGGMLGRDGGTRGELLPDRQDRSSLPVSADPHDRERYAHRAEILARDRDHARRLQIDPAPAGARTCACGCGAVLPPQLRRKDGRLRAGQRGIQWIRGHHRRGRR